MNQTPENEQSSGSGSERVRRRKRRSESRRRGVLLKLKKGAIVAAGLLAAAAIGFLATGGTHAQQMDGYLSNASSHVAAESTQTVGNGASGNAASDSDGTAEEGNVTPVDGTKASSGTNGSSGQTAQAENAGLVENAGNGGPESSGGSGMEPAGSMTTVATHGTVPSAASTTPVTADQTATTATTAASTTTESYVETGNWLEDRIARHRSEIAAQDLADFRSIIGKIDQGYISGLAAGGFTEEELTLLSQHLNSRLSGGEVSRAKELFSQYSYLLDEDA